MENQKKSHGFGIASLVLGIMSILSLSILPLALVLGILAIIFAIVQKKKESTGISTAGLITGIIGTLISTALLVMSIIIFNAMESGVDGISGAVPLI